MLRLTVRRPDGTVETVTSTNNIALLEKMREATRKAGRGEIIAYEEYVETAPLTLQEQRAELMASIITSPRNDAEWRQRASAIAAVAAFDAEHPEVLAEAQARRDARHADSTIVRGLD